MDDIYFSDKPQKSKKHTPGQPQSDNAADDTFSNRPVVKDGKDGKFVVHLPDEGRDSVVRDRTPKGKPVESVQTGHGGEGMPQYTPKPAQQFDVSSYETPAAPMPRRKTQPAPVTSRPQTAPNGRPKQKPHRRKKHTGLKIFGVILAILVVLLGAVFAYGYFKLGKITVDKDFTSDNPYVEAGSLSSSPMVKNILLIGSDARGDVGGQRSDTMLLLSIDSAHHKLKLTSFLRDSYVYIPEKKANAKLNAAFSWGGPNMLVDTIEYNFKIKIDDYLLIDFVGFQKMIDAMGGLDVEDVTAAEAKYMRDVVKIIYCKEGKNHFTGAASLWYCRIRYLDDDFHRTERQRKVVQAILHQSLKKNPATWNKMLDAALPMMQTSMSRNALLGAGIGSVFNFLFSKHPQFQVPAENTWQSQRIGGQAVLRLDMEENQKLLKEFIYQ